MSAAQHHTTQHLEFDTESRERMAATVGLLMRLRGVANRKALATALAPYGMSQSTVYSRLSRATDWQGAEIRALATVLDVPAAAIFCDPDAEALAPILGMSDADFLKALVRSSQNWKMLTRSDLQVLEGAAAPSSGTRKGGNPNQLPLPMSRERWLHAVPEQD